MGTVHCFHIGEGSDVLPTCSDAEDIAIQALGFLAQDLKRTERFLQFTGLSVDNIRSAAKDRAFLQGVLDYLASDQALIQDFAEASGLTPEEVSMSTRSLRTKNPKAEQWTAPKRQAEPTGPALKIVCECGNKRAFDRRFAKDVPAVVMTIKLSQCERCGEAELTEAVWLDAEGNEVQSPD